ncbi:mariner Mos1 transposase [Trichonephila clavipes]|nr:mariner Mos1 transposase [Trichonephila clavipes]
MPAYEPNSRHLREVSIFCFNMKKSAAEAHRMLSNTYGETAISERTCLEWFQRFKNGDFEVEDQHDSGRDKVFEDAELEAVLDQDSCRTQQELAGSLRVTQQAISKLLKVMGRIQKQGNWVPHELKPRYVERCLFACEQLLARQRRKGFLHRIVTGDEKWVRYDNPKRRKSWGYPGHASTSSAKPNIHGSKHDNDRPHVAKVVKTYLETLKWEVLPHPLYSPGLAPSDYHLFRSMAHGLAVQHFRSYEEVKNWIDSWITSKDDQFFQRGIRMLPERWEKVVASHGKYFESQMYNQFFTIKPRISEKKTAEAKLYTY